MWPQLTGLLDFYRLLAFQRNCVHCWLFFLSFFCSSFSLTWFSLESLCGEERVKGMPVSLNLAPQAWPHAACVSSCQRDNEQHRSFTCDGFTRINAIGSPEAATQSDMSNELRHLHDSPVSNQPKYRLILYLHIKDVSLWLTLKIWQWIV